jgi:hypothetical protein
MPARKTLKAAGKGFFNLTTLFYTLLSLFGLPPPPLTGFRVKRANMVIKGSNP